MMTSMTLMEEYLQLHHAVGRICFKCLSETRRVRSLF